MPLHEQILTLFTSYLFGIFFSLFLSVNYHIIYETKKPIRIFGTFLFVALTVLIYFLLLQKINHGVLHPYAFMVILCGILTEHYLEQFLKPHLKSIWKHE